MSDNLTNLNISKYVHPNYMPNMTTNPRKITMLQQLFLSSNSNCSVVLSAFVLGMVLTLKDNSVKDNDKFLSNPLKKHINVLTNGFLSASLAQFMAIIIPKYLRFLIPLTTLITCLYYKKKL